MKISVCRGTAYRGEGSPQLVLESEIIRDHGNKFAIGGLAAIVLDRVSKVGIERIHVAAIPRDLDGVADGAFHPGGGGGILLGHRGVEHLGHRVDDVAILYGHEDRCSQIVIALFE